MLYGLDFKISIFAYIEFTEKGLNAQLLDYFSFLSLFRLIKICSDLSDRNNSRTCWKYNKDVCRFSFVRYFTEKTIIKKKTVDSKFSYDKE